MEEQRGQSGVRIALLESRIGEINSAIARLDRCINGNGKPGLEERMTALLQTLKIDLEAKLASDRRHTKANFEESDEMLAAELRAEKIQREEQHKSNLEIMKEIGNKVDRWAMLFASMASAGGIIFTLERLGVIHFVGK